MWVLAKTVATKKMLVMSSINCNISKRQSIALLPLMCWKSGVGSVQTWVFYHHNFLRFNSMELIFFLM